MKSLSVFLFFIFFSLFSQAVYSQDFASIDQDLAQLEDLISDTSQKSEEQQKLLEPRRAPGFKWIYTIISVEFLFYEWRN